MRILFILFFIISSLFAQNIVLKKSYDVSYGIFSKLGISDAYFSANYETNTYEARITANANGFAKVLSKNRSEIYVSKGEIKDGKFLPKIFYKQSSNNSKDREKEYFFDHINKKVELVKTTRDKKGTRTSKEILEYYAKDDILSLFFNLKDSLKDLEIGVEKDFIAVGNDKNNGIISLKKLDKDSLKVYLNQKIFSSKRGELDIVLDEDGLSKTAILKDVLLFGDIVAK